MKKQILVQILMWVAVMSLIFILVSLFIKVGESSSGLIIIVLIIMVGLIGTELIYRYQLNQTKSQYSELKKDAIYEFLFSWPLRQYPRIPYIKYEEMYIVLLRGQDGSKRNYVLDKKPPKWFKYTGDINNPYEPILPQ